MNLNTAKLRDLAYKKGLNQTKVSELTGIARTSTNAIFCGRACTEETATKIAEVLGVSLDSITAK